MLCHPPLQKKTFWEQHYFHCWWWKLERLSPLAHVLHWWWNVYCTEPIHFHDIYKQHLDSSATTTISSLLACSIKPRLPLPQSLLSMVALPLTGNSLHPTAWDLAILKLRASVHATIPTAVMPPWHVAPQQRRIHLEQGVGWGRWGHAALPMEIWSLNGGPPATS